MDPFHIRADWILAARDRVYAPGVITIRGGLVEKVTEASVRAVEPVDLDLEGYALLPGLVNPHTHLEFSDLDQPLPAGENFPAWIGRVIRQRLSRGEDAAQLLRHSIAQGLLESRDAGVAALADIVTPPWTPDYLNVVRVPRTLDSAILSRLLNNGLERLQAQTNGADTVPKVIACLEILGVTGDRASQLRAWRDELLSIPMNAHATRLIDFGLSPHAPYSTPIKLWQESASLAARSGRLMVMHLAESIAEREWIDRGTGPMAEMLARIGAADHRPRVDWIEQAITQLAEAPRALVVHGNYLTESEMNRIAEHRDRLSVVYCPRTHAHFGHDAYPLEQLRQRGIRVVLGTDSRSSNPDLNVWRDAAHAVARHPTWQPSQALDAITQSAAESLGISPRFGTLLPGAVAALNAIPTFELSDIEEILARNFAETEKVIVVAH